MINQVLHCPYCHETDIVLHGLSPEGKQWIGSTNGIFALPSRRHASAAAVRHATQHGHTQPRHAAQGRGG